MASKFDLPEGFDAVLDELVARPRPGEGTISPSGAVLLSSSRTSDVWALWDKYALKLFRHRMGTSVPDLMAAEIATYEKIPSAQASGLPNLYCHARLGSINEDSAPCGWALYSLVRGKPLNLYELERLDDNIRNRWVHDVVAQTAKIEICLNSIIDPPITWQNRALKIWVPRLIHWAHQGKASEQEKNLAIRLKDLIEIKASTRQFLHGDLSLSNIITDLGGLKYGYSIVKFIDPQISYEVREANWRHFTVNPKLAEQLATEYDSQTGYVTNRHLMYVIGAMTHLYLSIAIPEQALVMRSALDVCLKEIGVRWL